MASNDNQGSKARKIINYEVIGENRKSCTLGKTCYLDPAKAWSTCNRFNSPYPHHDPVIDSLFLAYRIGESLDLPVHGKPDLSHQCKNDFRLSGVT